MRSTTRFTKEEFEKLLEISTMIPKHHIRNVRDGEKKLCIAPGCRTKTLSRGLCVRHYNKLKYHGLIGPTEKQRGCVVDGCQNSFWCRHLCRAHYQQHYKSDYEKYLTKVREGDRNRYHRKVKTDPEFLAKRRVQSKARYHQRQEQNMLRSSTPEARFKAGIRNAKKSGREWLISYDEFAAIIKNPCTYCGADLNSQAKRNGVGLDRIDNALGYTTSNVLVCCAFCNKLRNNLMSVEETMAVISLLKTLRNQSNPWENFKSVVRTPKLRTDT